MKVFEVREDSKIYTYELDTDSFIDVAHFHAIRTHSDYLRVTIGVRNRNAWRWEEFVSDLNNAGNRVTVAALHSKFETEEKKSKIFQLNQWIMDLIPYGQYDKYVQVLEDSGKGGDGKQEYIYRVSIFTKSRHLYRINATDRSWNDGYLGCTSSNLYKLAGEDHTRGCDLPDGPFNADTWRSIVNAIVQRELRELDT